MGAGHVPVQGTLGHVTFAATFAEVGLGELVLCQLVESENCESIFTYVVAWVLENWFRSLQ